MTYTEPGYYVIRAKCTKEDGEVEVEYRTYYVSPRNTIANKRRVMLEELRHYKHVEITHITYKPPVVVQ